MNTVVQPLEIVQANFGMALPFTLLDGNGNAINLSGLTLTLVVQDANDPTQTNLTLGGNPMTIDNATSGLCHYTVAAGDFPNVGTFLCQIVLTTSGLQETIQGPNIVVLPALPRQNN